MPAESSVERAARKASATLLMALPIVGCLGVMSWPRAALPRSGKFDGAEPFRHQVRQLAIRAFLPDVVILLIAILSFLSGARPR